MKFKEFGLSAIAAALLTISSSSIAANSGAVVSTQAKANQSSEASQQKKSTIMPKVLKACWQNTKAYYVKSTA